MKRSDLYDQDMASLAKRWLVEMRTASEEQPVAIEVTAMNFFAPPAAQWDFLRAVVQLAETADELLSIAVGPFEHLLGWHGPDYIELVEAAAAADPKFAFMTTGAWQYMMKDDVWARVQAIQARAEAADWRPVGG